MKKCPTCNKTFDGGMRFCQTDGTPLMEVADAAGNDPYKTVVASQDEIASAIPLDPFKTMVAPPLKEASPPPQKDDELVLELPEEPDMLKTMVSSQVDEVKPFSFGDSAKKETPASPFDDVFSQSKEKQESSSDKFSAGDAAFSTANEPPTPNSNPFTSDTPSTQASYEEFTNTPIPSPFDESMIGYQAMSKPLPPLKQSESAEKENNIYGTSPYNQPAFKEAEIKAEALNTPYAEQFGQPQNQPVQSNWTPPPAPDANWQNQQIGQNTPFQPPVAGQGQNQTLPIISLVLGILSLCCYVSPITGIAALITGYLGMKNVNNDPANYGGKTLAIVGMILGGLFLLIGILYWVLILLGVAASFIPQ